MSEILSVQNLRKSFKRHFYSSRFEALKGLSFSIPKGVATGFLGANGSGKTTSFKCTLDLLKRDAGEVLFFSAPLSLKSRAKIGFLPERPRFYEDLSAYELLSFYGRLSGEMSEKSLRLKIEEGLKELDLSPWSHKRLKTFSKGMLQKVGILQALIHEPKLLILDEPFSGLDPESRLKAGRLFERELHRGCTIFLSSHIFQDIERLCDHLLIIKEGELIFEGSFLDLQEQAAGKGYARDILYLLRGKKHRLSCSAREQSQREIQRLIAEGAEILSVQSEGGGLERLYKGLMAQQVDKETELPGGKTN